MKYWYRLFGGGVRSFDTFARLVAELQPESLRFALCYRLDFPNGPLPEEDFWSEISFDVGRRKVWHVPMGYRVGYPGTLGNVARTFSGQIPLAEAFLQQVLETFPDLAVRIKVINTEVTATDSQTICDRVTAKNMHEAIQVAASALG